MITLENVSKSYQVRSGVHRVLQGLSAEFPPDRNIGILGKNGAGKTTLLRLIAGVEGADSGRIIRKGRISWPIGFAGGFHGSLSGRENIRFVCRIHRVDYRKIIRFVEDFSELGEYIDMPFKTYSSGMKAKLGFGVSMAIDFDCYLVDEVTAVGDESFRQKCSKIFAERRARSNLIMVSHSISTIKQYCDTAAVLSKRNLIFFETVDEAVQYYNHEELKLGPKV